MADTITAPLNKLVLDLDQMNASYRFYLAGHLYGDPRNRDSLFPASTFIAYINRINSDNAQFFVSLGDNYRMTKEIYLTNFKKSVAEKLKIPMFNAVGNHDVTNREVYEKEFGKTYYCFRYNMGLFIFLDSELNAGNIVGDQLDFFVTTTQEAIKDQEIRHVFIFSHKLIWGVGDPKYQVIMKNVNSGSGYTSNDNFRKDVQPVLVNLSKYKSTYWISGDVGCSWSIPFFSHKDLLTNITYIATGIGDTKEDMIVRSNVDSSGHIKFNLVSLTEKPVAKVENYGLDYWENRKKQLSVGSYFRFGVFVVISLSIFLYLF